MTKDKRKPRLKRGRRRSMKRSSRGHWDAHERLDGVQSKIWNDWAWREQGEHGSVKVISPTSGELIETIDVDPPTAIYALWRGGECLTNILATQGLDAAQVRSIAVESHEKVPLNYGDGMTPYEHAQALRRARVKVYEDGKGRVIE